VTVSDGRLGIQLRDTRGVIWDVLNGPVRLGTGGIKGLGLPEVDYFTNEAAGLDGERETGWRLKARPVILPVRFKGEAERDTTGIQRQFWAGQEIGKDIGLIVTDRDGAVRTLTMRIEGDGGLAYRINPDTLAPEQTALAYKARDPWWYGPEIETAFSIGDGGGADFFNGAAMAPSFNIETASGQTATTINNPGEQPMWLRWFVGGASTQFRLGVGGRAIAGSFVIADGSWLTIDTDPRGQLAYLDGQKIPFRSFTELGFAPVPAGSDVPVTIEITGRGVVRAVGRPRYRRAF
jgi:hypothetical protein